MRLTSSSYTTKPPLLIRLRYWLIELLAGDMPVVLNMTIQRPVGFVGTLASFPNPDRYGIFCKNFLQGEMKGDVIMLPTADSSFLGELTNGGRSDSTAAVSSGENT